MLIRILSGIGIVSLVTSLLTPTLLFSDDSETSLSGRWVLNQSMSDDSEEVFNKSRSNMRSGRGGGGRGPGGMSGGRGGSGPGMGGSSGGYGREMDPGSRSGGDDDARRLLQQAVLTSEKLTITLSDIEIMFDTGQGEPKKYLIDGRGTPLDKELTVVFAGWENDQMVVEKTTGGGQKLIERYTVSSSGSQLHVAISMRRPNSTDMIKIQRVFDRIG